MNRAREASVPVEAKEKPPWLASALAVGVGSERAIGKSKRGWATKIQTFADAKGQPVGLHLTGGNVSDYVGYEMLPVMADGRVECRIGDRGWCTAVYVRSLRLARRALGLSGRIQSSGGRHRCL